MMLNFGKSVKSWCYVICLEMLCGVVYGVLDCWCGVVEAGTSSKVSGLSMYVTLVGFLRGKMIHRTAYLNISHRTTISPIYQISTSSVTHSSTQPRQQTKLPTSKQRSSKLN
jgi:hypothetical protein